MGFTTEEKGRLIISDIVKEEGCDPGRIFRNMAKKEYISIHGPEHHILDGACILTAFRNAGGMIDLDESLKKAVSGGYADARSHVRALGCLRSGHFCRSSPRYHRRDWPAFGGRDLGGPHAIYF